MNIVQWDTNTGVSLSICLSNHANIDNATSWTPKLDLP